MSPSPEHLHFETVRAQTIQVRKTIQSILISMRGHEEEMPPTWKNNALWHAGHLVLTNRLLTYRLAGEQTGYPAEYMEWFRKGTGPDAWKESATKPDYEKLLQEIITGTEELFDAMKDRWTEKYPEPYTTTPGVVLSTPGDALNFSFFHDGIHVGLLLALRRELKIG